MNITMLKSPLGMGVFAKPFIPLEQGAVEGFAQEMARRAELAPKPEGVARTVDAKGLEEAVSGAVDYIKDRFGDRAARAVMGIVVNRAGYGPLTEESLGDGFTDALEFVDKSFGVAEGDKAMAFFNGALNNAINGFFQNGKNESFLALDLGQAKEELGQAVGQAVSGFMKKIEANSFDGDGMLMDSAKEDFDASMDESGAGVPGENEAVPAGAEGAGAVAGETSPVSGGASGQAAPDGSAPDGSGQASGGAASANATGGGTAPTAGGESGAAGQTAPFGEAKGHVEKTEPRPGKRIAGSKRRGGGPRRVRRRRAEAQNPYDRSGITPGLVLDKKI
jgi:hypothetical protein